MGMKKSAEIESSQVDKAFNTLNQTPTNNFLSSDEYIPFEFYKYFSLNPADVSSSEKDMIERIYKCVYKGSIGDALSLLRKSETKVGVPALGESRLSKVFNYVTIKNKINVIKSDNGIEWGVAKGKIQEAQKITRALEK